jgi:hypothetical protein
MIPFIPRLELTRLASQGLLGGPGDAAMVTASAGVNGSESEMEFDAAVVVVGSHSTPGGCHIGYTRTVPGVIN